jgi:EAL domain-containing protein (putative c-di-GMP-specific phosphodiesterase class I)
LLPIQRTEPSPPPLRSTRNTAPRAGRAPASIRAAIGAPARRHDRPQHLHPAAEELSLIVTIGQWVLETACAQLHAWHAAGHDLRVVVNFSVAQFGRHDIADTVAHTLERGACWECMTRARIQ